MESFERGINPEEILPKKEVKEGKEFDPGRRKALRTLAGIGLGLATGTLVKEFAAHGGEPKQEASKQFDRHTLPLPEFNFDALPLEHRKQLARALLNAPLTREVPASDNIDAFNSLKTGTEEKIAEIIFKRHELLIRLVRNTLIGWGENSLNPTQQDDIGRFKHLLGGEQIIVHGLKELTNTVHEKNPKELHALFQELIACYQTFLEHPKRHDEEVIPEAPEKSATPAEQKETSPDHYIDPYGQKFGWGFRTQFFPPDTEKIEYPDLHEFEGRERNGNPITLSLRKDAYDAWMSLVNEAKAEGITLSATEAFRTIERQKQMRRRFGRGAALPGKSEHHLGTTVDIRNAVSKKLYDWLMFPHGHGLPRMIAHGFVPTIVREAWHFRYVGVESANRYWAKEYTRIIASHSRLLQSDKNPKKRK